MKFPAALLVLIALATSPFTQAQQDEAAQREQLRKLADGLNYQKGEIALKGGLAKIRVPEEFRYLDSKDAGTVLTRLWGNPPGAVTLGMLVPAGASPANPEGWGVIITYDEDGYVKDDEAEKMDYPKLMKQMQEGMKEENEERVKEGYASIELVGWATPPRYDKATHKMYWAKELKFAGNEENTLNYNIRMLGRRGVLVLNAVAGMSQLAEIEKATPGVLAMVDFQEGHRYTDFDASTDKVATYGIAALVAGGLAAKAGLFKGLLVALLAAKKFVIMALIGVAVWAKKFFGKKE